MLHVSCVLFEEYAAGLHLVVAVNEILAAACLERYFQALKS